MESNSSDIEKFYDLLGHEKETEIRVFLGPTRNFFVKNKKEFIEKTIELNNAGFDVYAGINERRENGTKADDVKYLGIMFIDFDAHTEQENIEDVKKEVLELANEFNQNGVICSVDFSGRGYHLLIPFKRIELNEKNKEIIKNRIDKFKRMLVERYNVDSSTFDFSRVCRITGTINHNNNTLSKFIEFKGRSNNDVLFKFIDGLPDNKKPSIREAFDNDLEKQRFCGFFEDVALNNKFPEGSRHLTLAKNLAVYCSGKDKENLKESFIQKQGMSKADFEGWEKQIKDKKLNRFNCGEIINYCKENNLPNVCTFCPYNNFKYNIKKVNITDYGVKASFVIEKLVYQYKKVNIDRIKNVSYLYPYHIFKVNVAAGGHPRFLLVRNKSDVREGDFVHYVRPLRQDKEFFQDFLSYPPDELFLKKVLKWWGLSDKDISKSNNLFTEVLNQDSSEIDGGFIILSYGVEKNSILGLSNEDDKEIIENFTTLGMDIDEKVKLAFLSDFFIPSLENTNYMTYQYYNNHKLLFTDTKAMKTSASSRIGHNATRSSVKNLLGFATGDEIYRGTLHENIYPYYVDELQEDESKSIYGKLLNFMELGNINIDLGRKSIVCKGLSSLTFLGNPKEENRGEDIELAIASQFNSTLNLITNNYVALGSRFGFVLFDPHTKRVTGECKFLENDYDLLLAKYEVLRNLASINFSNMFRNKKILDFLNKKYDDIYKNILDQIINQCSVKSIREFLIGHVDSYRHANGMALRLALVDHLNDLINEMLDIDKLLVEAENYLSLIEKINIDSFRVLVSGEKVKQFFINYYKTEFNNDSIYDKVLLDSIYRYYVSNDKSKKEIMVSSLLEFIKSSIHKPENFSINTISEKFNRQKISRIYKIDFSEIDSLQYFVIRDPSVLEYIFEDSSKDPQKKIL